MNGAINKYMFSLNITEFKISYGYPGKHLKIPAWMELSRDEVMRENAEHHSWAGDE